MTVEGKALIRSRNGAAEVRRGQGRGTAVKGDTGWEAAGRESA